MSDLAAALERLRRLRQDIQTDYESSPPGGLHHLVLVWEHRDPGAPEYRVPTQAVRNWQDFGLRNFARERHRYAGIAIYLDGAAQLLPGTRWLWHFFYGPPGLNKQWELLRDRLDAVYRCATEIVGEDTVFKTNDLVPNTCQVPLWSFALYTLGWDWRDHLNYEIEGQTHLGLLDAQGGHGTGGPPFADRAGFESWARGTDSRSLDTSWMMPSRDIRACTLELIDRILQFPLGNAEARAFVMRFENTENRRALGPCPRFASPVRTGSSITVDEIASYLTHVRRYHIRLVRLADYVERDDRTPEEMTRLFRLADDARSWPHRPDWTSELWSWGWLDFEIENFEIADATVGLWVAHSAAHPTYVSYARANIRRLEDAMGVLESQLKPPTIELTGKATEAARDSLELDKLVDKMLLIKPKSGNQINLVKYMWNRTSATCDDIKTNVHGNDDVSDEAVRANVSRANDLLAEAGSTISFGTGTDYVFKRIAPV
jgi:hypothetical protein